MDPAPGGGGVLPPAPKAPKKITGAGGKIFPRRRREIFSGTPVFTPKNPFGGPKILYFGCLTHGGSAGVFIKVIKSIFFLAPKAPKIFFARVPGSEKFLPAWVRPPPPPRGAGSKILPGWGPARDPPPRAVKKGLGCIPQWNRRTAGALVWGHSPGLRSGD